MKRQHTTQSHDTNNNGELTRRAKQLDLQRSTASTRNKFRNELQPGRMESKREASSNKLQRIPARPRDGYPAGLTSFVTRGTTATRGKISARPGDGYPRKPTIFVTKRTMYLPLSYPVENFLDLRKIGQGRYNNPGEKPAKTRGNPYKPTSFVTKRTM